MKIGRKSSPLMKAAFVDACSEAKTVYTELAAVTSDANCVDGRGTSESSLEIAFTLLITAAQPEGEHSFAGQHHYILEKDTAVFVPFGFLGLSFGVRLLRLIDAREVQGLPHHLRAAPR